MANDFEGIRDEYAQQVEAGRVHTWLNAPVYHPMTNPDDPEGPALEGPHDTDLRPTQLIRTDDRRLPIDGMTVGTPEVKFLFLPPQVEREWPPVLGL